MALHATRNKYGGQVPVVKDTSAAAIVRGCPVNIDTSGLLAANVTSAANPTKTVGFAVSAADGASDEVDYVPGYPGIQFLLDFSGTYAATDHKGKNFGITVTSGVPVVDLTDATNDTVKFMELEGTTLVNGKAWFELCDTASQLRIEVA